MRESSPFDLDPKVSAMKEDVAKRVFRLKTIEGIITLATMAVAAVAMFTFLPALATGGGLVAGIAKAAIPLALTAAGGLASYATMKERKRLEIDESYLQSRMSGRNNWESYREEVMEKGHGEAPQAALSPSLPNPSIGQARGK